MLIRKIVLPTSLFFLSLFTYAGTSDSTITHRFGVIGAFDYAYNFGDKVLTPGLGRKGSVGISFCNRKRQFITYVMFGIKGVKFNAYSPKFQQGFLDDVKASYVPTADTNEARLIGIQMGVRNGEGLWGTYGYFFHAGFIWNNSWKPSIDLYYGDESFLLYGDGFARYEDPKHGDINYVSMTTHFYELKLGATLPIHYLDKKPFTLHLHVGYKWVDYGHFQFNETRMSDYTSSDVAGKYRYDGKLTVSLSFMGWSNWK